MITLDGTAETEEAIKAETKATIRCIPLLSTMESGKCVYSGKGSARRVVFARASLFDGRSALAGGIRTLLVCIEALAFNVGGAGT